MAKKKEAPPEKVGNDKDQIHDAIIKKHGDVFLSADYFIGRPKKIIPISPTLDNVLGGGIPQGSWVVITGKEKLGKTTLCLSFAANAQKQGYHIYYFNIEGRIKERDWLGIEGLDLSPEKLTVIGSSEEGVVMTGEQYLDTLLDLAHGKKDSVFILDSVSQLCSSKKHAHENLAESFRDDMPSMMSTVTKRCCNVLPVNRNIMMFITHIIADTSGKSMSGYSEASGRKIQYQADVKLKATYKKDYEVQDRQVGQEVFWQCDTNALSASPHQKCSSMLRYGVGVDKYYDLLNICKEIGLVPGSTWLTIGEQKLQGMENAVKYLKNNPEAYDNLLKQFEELTK